jgi:hypothetical protein
MGPARTRSSGSSPGSLAAADLDADGDDDLVVSNGSAHSVSILRRNESGSYAVAATLPVGFGPRRVVLDHWDNTGDFIEQIPDEAIPNHEYDRRLIT